VPGQTEPEDAQRLSNRPPESEPPPAQRHAPSTRPPPRPSIIGQFRPDETGTWPAARLPTFDPTLSFEHSPSDDLDQELARISPAFRASELRPRILRFAYDPRHSALVDEIARGGCDLVMLGAENRAIHHKLFFGYEAQRIIARTSVSLVVVVPKTIALL
jgi:nucleotide-binding universal stress UspA family protein